jgi:hypothetical protein
MISKVLAVDFGTSTSHFSFCPGDELLPSSLVFDPNALGMESAVLFRKDRETLVGRMALDTWGDALETEQQKYDLRMHFKPDIAHSPEAWRAGAAFLQGVRREAENMYASLDQAGRVFFGVPSEAGEDWRQALRTLAREGGFGEVELVDEPVGALLYHLSQKDLKPSESLEGTLVVDFGGGTCDFAWMQRLEVKASWGDMLLGGRLLDDLFYQMLCEENPGLEERLEREGAAYYVHWYECRRMKESFSLAMSRNLGESWNGRAGNYGALRNLSWESFRERASRYLPTPSFGEHLRQVEGQHFGEKPLDLLGWFRSSLRQGLEQYGLQGSAMGRVILSGGSSSWPFVVHILQEELDLPREKILRSSRPGAVIAEGISLLPALRHRYSTLRQSLEEDLPRFVQEDIRTAVGQLLFGGAEEVARHCEARLFQGSLRGVVEHFREEGGTLKKFREDLERCVEQEEPQIAAILEKEMRRIFALLPGEIARSLGNWLSHKGIRTLPPHLEGGDLSGASWEKNTLSFAPESLYGNPLRLFEGTLAVMTSAVTASICGGTGLALVISGPLGLVVGGIAGLLAYGAFRKELYRVRLPSLVTKRMISRKRMEKILSRGGEAYRKMVEERFEEAWKEEEPQLLEQIERLVALEVASLSALHTL